MAAQVERRLSLRNDPDVKDSNILERLRKIGNLDQVLSFDVSWTAVSPTGLGKALTLLPNLLELFYESPLLLTDFPIRNLPSSVVSLHLHSECTEFGGHFSDIYDSNDSERLKNLWKRSQCGPVDINRPSQGYVYHSRTDAEPADQVIERITWQGQNLELVCLDTSTKPQGTWSADDSEKAVRALPSSVKRLTLTALQHRKPLEYGSVAASHDALPSDPPFLPILVEKFGNSLESLDITLADAPSEEFHLFYKFKNLKELSMNRVHAERFEEPFSSSIEYFQGSIPLGVHPKIQDNIFNFMTNLTYLNVGGEWLQPEIVSRIGTSLVHLKTLYLNGNNRDIVDALAATPLSKTIQNLMSNTLQWDWFSKYLMPSDASGDSVTQFPELRYVQLCEDFWAYPHAEPYPQWNCQFKQHRDKDPSTIFRYSNRKYCIIFEHRN